MNIAEKFEAKKREEKQAQIMSDQRKMKDLAHRIITALSDKETIESIENYLIERGSVSVKDFGCLCQRSFCNWQKGLGVLLQPLVDEWGQLPAIEIAGLR